MSDDVKYHTGSQPERSGSGSFTRTFSTAEIHRLSSAMYDRPLSMDEAALLRTWMIYTVSAFTGRRLKELKSLTS